MDAVHSLIAHPRRKSYSSAFFRVFANVLFWSVVLQVDSPALIALGLAHLVFSLLWLGILRFAFELTQRGVGKYLTRFADALATTGLVHASGGPLSPLILGYTVITVLSSLNKDRRQGRAAVLFSSGLFLLLIVLLQLGVVAPVNVFVPGFSGVGPLSAATIFCFMSSACYGLYRITFKLADLDRSGRRLAEEQTARAEKARAEVEKLNEFSKKINASLDLDEILPDIFEYLLTTFNTEAAFIALMDPQANRLLVHQWTISANFTAEQSRYISNLRIPMDARGGAVYRVCERKRPFYMMDTEVRMGHPFDQEVVNALHLKSFLMVPLIVHDRVLGMLYMTSYVHQMRLSKSDIASISRFGEQIAGAINSASLLKRVEAERQKAERTQNEIEKLNEFARKINQTTDLDQVLQQIFAFIETAFHIERTWLVAVDQDRKELRTLKYSAGFQDLSAETLDFLDSFRVSFGPEAGVLFRTYERQKPFYLARIAEKSIRHETDQMIFRKLQLRSYLHVPLIVRNEVMGIACFTARAQSLRLSKPDIASIARFCEQIAGAVHTASLLRETEEARKIAERERAKTERARAEIQKLNEFSRWMNETRDLDQILGAIFSHFDSEYGIESLVLLNVDTITRELYSYTIANPPPPNPTEEMRRFARDLRLPLDPGSGMIYRTYLRKRPFYLAKMDARASIEGSPAMQRMANELKLRSFLLVPLVVQNETIAMLLCTSYTKDFVLTKAQIESISNFCQQIAGAIHSSHLFRDAEVARAAAEIEKAKSDSLLLNILPEKVANELMEKGAVEPLFYDSVTVLFTDLVGFTEISETMMPDELVEELDGCFTQFDEIANRHGLEKLKTIGDAYMCCGGIPDMNYTHAVDACLAGLEFQAFMNQMRSLKSELALPFWRLRLGAHTGPVTTGVVGKSKFAYDIWGDTVNTASRCESSGESGRVNISGDTYRLVGEFFECEHRGKVAAKGKGEIDMYFVNRIRQELSRDPDGHVPNDKFRRRYETLRAGP